MEEYSYDFLLGFYQETMRQTEGKEIGPLICVKCGYSIAPERRWHIDSVRNPMTDGRCCEDDQCIRTFQGEHMHLTCNSCAYEWCINPLVS